MAQEGKTLPAYAGDTRDAGSVPGSGRSPGEGHGGPLRYFFSLENPTDRGAWWATVHGVAQSWTRLSDEHLMHQENVQGLVTPSLNPSVKVLSTPS